MLRRGKEAVSGGAGPLIRSGGRLKTGVGDLRGPMTQFDDRERAAEKKFELDQEKEFRAQARRAKLVGLWAAEQMGLDGAEAEGYAKDVVAHDLAEKGDEDLFRKIRVFC